MKTDKITDLVSYHLLTQWKQRRAYRADNPFFIPAQNEPVQETLGRISRTLERGYEYLVLALPSGLRREAEGDNVHLYLNLREEQQRIQGEWFKRMEYTREGHRTSTPLESTHVIMYNDVCHLFKDAATAIDGGRYDARRGKALADEIVTYFVTSPIGHPQKFSFEHRDDRTGTLLRWHPPEIVPSGPMIIE